MKSNKPHRPRRPYQMKARARAAEETARRILDATLTLFKQRAYDHITLQDVADLAGVSLQTVLRRFGSKEGLIATLMEHDHGGFRTQRDQVPPGDLAAIVRVLVAQYEEYGDAIIRNLNLEERFPEVRAMLAYGRTAHREWVAQAFASFLPSPDADAYDRRLALFIAATDVYLWKLLRRDHGLDAEETERAMRELLDSLIAAP